MLTQCDEKPLVMIIEDDPSVTQTLTFYLRDHFRLVVASSYDEAMQTFLQVTPALLVLDIKLDDDEEAGFRLCRHIRDQQHNGGPMAHLSEIMILMLTGLDMAADGLNLGADDYLRKPFGKQELVARINALLRRVRPSLRRNTFDVYPVVIDTYRRIVMVDGKELALTNNEYNMLYRLVQEPGQTVSRQDILGKDIKSRTVDETIRKLRKKLGQVYDGAEKMIETVYGRDLVGTDEESERKGGYRIVPLR